MAHDLNVLLLISDQHRGDFVGAAAQPELNTPNMDGLAENGASFTRAYCPSPLCVPSRAALLAGKFPAAIGSSWQEEVLQNHLTLPQHLRNNGFYTGHIGKGHLMGETKEHLFGFDERRMRYLYQTYEDYAAAADEETCRTYLGITDGCDGGYDWGCYNPELTGSRIPLEFHFDTLVADETLAFFGRNRHRRWFLQVGIEKPHPVWYPPSEFTRAVNPEQVLLPEGWRQTPAKVPKRRLEFRQHFVDLGYTDKDARGAKAAYIASINYVDWVVGRIVGGLKEAGLAEKTLVIYTSDHGDNCFEHGLLQKHCGYEGAIHIPLIVAGPGVKRNGICDGGLAELTDLYPTICEYLDVPIPEGLHGESLMPTLSGGDPPQKEIAVSVFYHEGWKYGLKYPEWVGRTLDWKYIDNPEDIPELYDEVNDPGELHNLADEAAHQDRLTDLKQKLARRISSW